MDIEEAIYKRRTIRRFKQDPVQLKILKKIVDFGRVAPMGNNIQSVEYIIVTDKEKREIIFPLLAWAGSLPNKYRHPEPDRRPTAYIIVLVNTNIKQSAEMDVGAAIENILLGALKFGLGSCWMGSIDREKLREIFQIPKDYKILNVISLGYPDEKSVKEPFNGSFKYWKDDEGVMHIPKRDLDDIIFKIY